MLLTRSAPPERKGKMDLLERAPILARLDALLADVVTRGGRITAVCGEAGAGKTSVVERFTAGRAEGKHALRGLCDALATPRPLGPIHDMAEQASGPLNAALRAGAGRDGSSPPSSRSWPVRPPRASSWSRMSTGPTTPPWTC